MANVGGIGGIFQELISPTKYPKVPSAPYVSPQTAQQQSIAGNISALPGLEQLGSGVDQYNLAQRRKMLEQSIPGFSNLINTGTANLGDWLHGVLSPDVASAVSRGANAQAVAGGYGGSGAAANLTARDLGLTSLQLQQGATSALPSYLGSLGNLLMPRQFDVTSGFISPTQQISANQWNELYRYKQQALVNEIAALPDPLIAAVGEAVGSNLNQDIGAARNFFSFGIGSKQEGGSAGGGGGGLQSYSGGFSSLMGMFGGGGGPEANPSFGFPGGTPEGPNAGSGEGILSMFGGMGGGAGMAFV